MLGNFWFVLLIGVLIGGTIAGFVCYRIGYNKMHDEAHKYAKMHLICWNL